MSTSTAALPELSDEYKQQQQQAVLDSDVLYQFELIKEPLPDYGTVIIWLIGAVLALWVGMLGDWIQFVMVLFFVGAMGTYLYYAGKPNIQQTVTLTEKGIIVSDLELVPDACYAALRYSGYVGVAISLVAAIFVGPMAFVGAGAGLLMSFKMAGVVNRPKMQIKPFIKGMVYFDWGEEVHYQHGVTTYFLSTDLKPYGLSDVTQNKMRNFHNIVYHATPTQRDQYIKMVNQVIQTQRSDRFLPYLY